MSRKKKNPAADAALPNIPSELIDQIVKGPMSADAVNAASKAFKKALIERCLGAELSHHLGYVPGAEKPEDANNHRNGTSGKTVLTEDGPLRIDVPRDREGSFEPVLIPKHERRFTGFDEKIIAMYARGMTVREIQGFLAEQYGTDEAESPRASHSLANASMCFPRRLVTASIRNLSSCSRPKPAYSTSARLSWVAKLATAPSRRAPLCAFSTAASDAFHPPVAPAGLPPAP
jgi:Transposase, Mutator family